MFPRAPSHAMPCSAMTPFPAVGGVLPCTCLHLRNAARPHTRGRAQGRIGGRGLRGLFTEVTHG